MKKSKEILFSTAKFDVIEKDDKVGIEPKGMHIAVLTYTTDGKGLPNQLGIMKEYNVMRSKFTNTVITGRAEGEDPDILTAAQRKLLDKSGLDVQDAVRWTYLGFLSTNKIVNAEIPCFACDITGMDLPEPEEDEDPDKAVDDKAPDFIILSVDKALDTEDCFIPAMFMKIFKYVVFNGDTPGEVEGSTEEPTEKPKSEKDENHSELLDIEGVLTATKNSDGKWITSS